MTRNTAETKLKAPMSRRPLASPTNPRASQTHPKSFSTRFPASPVSNHHSARVSENNVYFAPFDEDDRMSVDESYSDDELGEWIDGETLIAIEDVGNTEFVSGLSYPAPSDRLDHIAGRRMTSKTKLR